jgi:hypothetical protein
MLVTGYFLAISMGSNLSIMAREGQRPLLYVKFLSYPSPGENGKVGAVWTPTDDNTPPGLITE